MKNRAGSDGSHRWLIMALFLFLCAGLVLAGTVPTQTAASATLPTRRSSGIIALTADGATLLVANPDSNSVTLVDTAGGTVLAELQVGVDPRSVAVDDAGLRAYVANRGSDSVSIIDLSLRQAIGEVAVGDRPAGVLVSPDGRRLYVAVQGLDRLVVLDTMSSDIAESIAIPERPTGLALSHDGRTLYVTHLLSNEITVLRAQTYRIFLPLAWRGTALGGGTWTTMAQPSPRLTGTLTPTILLWPDSNLVQSVVIAPEGRRAYIPHTRSNTGNQALTFDTTVFPLVSVLDLEAGEHLVGQQFDLGTLDPPGVGLPWDAAVTPAGDELWVVNAASNDLSIIDLAGRTLTAHIEVGDNPRGIVLAPDGTSAYVNNALAGTVSVIDTAAYTVTDAITVTEIPLPPALLNGKRLFHSSDDPRMARAQWIACNTCHFEGEHDGRTWFFGFAGPRNTTSLMGMVETYPLRWSAEWDESADAEYANRRENFGAGLIDGEMYCALYPPDCVNYPPNQGRSYDLDCLAAFLDSLQAPLSPAHAGGERLDEAEARGQALFHDPALNCATCHPPPLYTDLQVHDVGTATADERIGPAYDTPTLRNLYSSAPYLHDGSAATLRDAITRATPGGEHDVSALLTDAQIEDLIAFLLALPYE